MCIYIYIYIYIFIYTYTYIHTYTHTHTIYRSLGVVSDKIASAKRNPVQKGNPPPTTTTNNGRCEGESQGKTRVLGSFLTIYMKQIKINGAGGSVTVVANPWVRRFPVSGVRCPWAAIDGTVRGPREI